MVRGSKTALAVALATTIDLGAVAVLVGAAAAGAACWVAAALHVGAAAALLLVGEARGSRRALVIAFGFTIPVVGAAMAVLALAHPGGSRLTTALDEDSLRDEGAHGELPLDATTIRDVAEALALPEALLVADVEQRRALLWGLSRRGDAEAVGLLRWALTASSTDLGMEAALALEDVTLGFQKRLDGHRRALHEAPTGVAALAAANLIAHGFEIGILDLVSVADLIDEGRRYCALAARTASAAPGEVALARARLELAALRSDVAFELVEQALPTATGDLQRQLRGLRDRAAPRGARRPRAGAATLVPPRRPATPHATPPGYETFHPVEAGQPG